MLVAGRAADRGERARARARTGEQRGRVEQRAAGSGQRLAVAESSRGRQQAGKQATGRQAGEGGGRLLEPGREDLIMWWWVGGGESESVWLQLLCMLCMLWVNTAICTCLPLSHSSQAELVAPVTQPPSHTNLPTSANVESVTHHSVTHSAVTHSAQSHTQSQSQSQSTGPRTSSSGSSFLPST